MSARPPHGDDAGGGRLAGGEIGDVAGDAHGLAARRRDLLCQAAGAVAVDVEHGDARALLREAQADRASDAVGASRAGHDGHAAVEAAIGGGSSSASFVLRSVEVATHVAGYRAGKGRRRRARG